MPALTCVSVSGKIQVWDYSFSDNGHSTKDPVTEKDETLVVPVGLTGHKASEDSSEMHSL